MNSPEIASGRDNLISSVEAGRRFGYTNDYVAKLAREGKIVATRVGQQWFVGADSLAQFVEQAKAAKQERAERVREERKLELLRAKQTELETTFTEPAMSAVIESTLAIRDNLISSVEAGRRFGYTNDYVAKLAREGKIVATRVGQQWFVGADSLAQFVEQAKAAKQERAERVREERKLELALAQQTETVAYTPVRTSRAVAVIESGLIMVSGVGLACLIFFAAHTTIVRQEASLADALMSMRTIALQLYGKSVVFDSAPKAAPEREAEAPMSDYARDGVMLVPEHSSVDDIKQSFSDPVNVTFDEDGRSGVIRPIFENPEENPDGYRFMLVPLQQP